MPDVLRGNFKPRTPVDTGADKEKTLEERFEKEAMKRLGGSIAFVSKRKVMWDAKDTADKKKKS